MTTLKLPTFADNLDHKYNITLDGVLVTMEFHLNRRADRWSINLFDVNNVPIRHGIRVAEGFDLLRRVALGTKPPGRLTFVDSTGNDTEPDAVTFGVDGGFRYVEAADL